MSKKHRRPEPPKPGNPFQQAVAFHQAGRFKEAEELYCSLGNENPDVLGLLGVLEYQTGRQDAGISSLKKALELQPKHAESLANLGVIHHERKEFEQALALFERALLINPSSADLLNKRGFVLQDLKRHGEAIVSFKLALDVAPNVADIWFNLGHSQLELNQVKDAEIAFRKVLALDPRNPDAMTNLGTALFKLRKPAEAVTFLQQSIQIRPQALTYNQLSLALAGVGEQDRALAAIKTATQLEPKVAAHYLAQGTLFQTYRNSFVAEESFRKAVQLNPQDPKSLVKLAVILNQVGKFEEGLSVLQSIENPTTAIKLASAIATPIIPMSTREIEDNRARCLRELQALADEDIRLADPQLELSLTNFSWSYHSESELELQKAVVKVYEKASPELFWQSPHLGEKRTGKIKVGVISAFLNRHTIGKLFIRLIAHLGTDDIEVTFLDSGRNVHDWTKELNEKVDFSYKLVPDLESSRQFIAGLKLDALFYTDIGMDPFTYYLAFARLAPLQFMTWGHPASTALPHMDCFLSSEDLEREGSEVDYSERLVKFKELMTVFSHPDTPDVSKEKLGLPEDKSLYVCPQTLFKLHPDFDHAFAEILRRDENGVIVLISGNENDWDTLLKQRFNEVMPDVANRILFLRRLSLEEFLALNKHATAILDTFYFGGGNSSLEGFVVGAPIVTLPGKMLRGRITLTQYRKMGIDDLIATDPEHYIELAVRLGKDPEFKAAMTHKILERNGVLYDNLKPIDELREFLRQECLPRR